MRLLSSFEPDPAIVRKGGADASFVIICDHAGRRVPESLGDLGLPAAAFERHIAWDIGALAMSERLAEAFDAPMIAQRYSRLVIDCNRDPAKPSAVPEISDGQRIPANVGLDPDHVAARVAEVHAPYHAAISDLLDERGARRAPTILLFVHSFTPRMDGFDRPWDLGVLHDETSPFASAVLADLLGQPGWVTGDNQPYALCEIDYSAPVHAQRRGLDFLELEVRQDHLGTSDGVARMADLLIPVLARAAGRVQLGQGDTRQDGG